MFVFSEFIVPYRNTFVQCYETKSLGRLWKYYTSVYDISNYSKRTIIAGVQKEYFLTRFYLSECSRRFLIANRKSKIVSNEIPLIIRHREIGHVARVPYKGNCSKTK